jgi:hypothetical protein
MIEHHLFNGAYNRGGPIWSGMAYRIGDTELISARIERRTIDSAQVRRVSAGCVFGDEHDRHVMSLGETYS